MTTRRECLPCDGIEARTPESVANRPGLPALRYRVGRHGTILETMQARLSEMYSRREAESRRAGGTPECSQPGARNAAPTPPWLHSRELNDPSIALLDAWATVGDVLTFYQERIANEGYLRTALERRSLTELARHVGYELRPALSASVLLAFDVQAPPSLDPNVKIPPPHEIKIPGGTQGKSVPLPGELPAVFETTEELTARPEWNVLRPRMFKPTDINALTIYEIKRLRIEPPSWSIRPGDMLLIEAPSDLPGLPIGVPRQVIAVSPEPPSGQADDVDTKPTIIVTLVDSAFSQRTYLLQIKKSSQQFLESIRRSLSEDVNGILPDRNKPLHSLQFKANEVVNLSLQRNGAAANLAKLDDGTWKIINELDEHIVAIDLNDFYEPWIDTTKSYVARRQELVANAFVNHINKHTLKHTETLAKLKLSIDATANYTKDPSFVKNLDKLRAAIEAFISLRDPLGVQGALLPLIRLLSATKAEASRLAVVDVWSQLFNALRAEFTNGLKYLSQNIQESAQIMGKLVEELSEEPSPSVALYVASWPDDLKNSSNPFIVDFIDALKGYIEEGKKQAPSEAASRHSLDIANGQSPDIIADRPLKEGIQRELKADINKVQNAVQKYKSDINAEADFDRLFELLKNNAATQAVVSGKELANEIRKVAQDFKKELTLPGRAVAQAAVIQLDRLSELSADRPEWKSRHIIALNRIVNNWGEGRGLSSIKSALTAIKDESSDGVMTAQIEHLIQLFKNPVTAKLGQGTDQKVKATQDWADQVFREREDRSDASRPRAARGLAAQMLTRMQPEQGQRMMTFLREVTATQVAGQAFAFRHRGGLFGSVVVPSPMREFPFDASKPVGGENPAAAPAIGDPAEEQNDEIYLDNEYTEIAAGGRCLVLSAAEEPNSGGGNSNDRTAPTIGSYTSHEIVEATIVHRTERGLSGKASRLRLRSPWRRDGKPLNHYLRSATIVHAGSIQLSLAEERINDLFPSNFDAAADSQRKLELSSFIGEFRVGATILVTGELVLKDDRADANAERETGVRETGVTVVRERRVIAAIDSGTSGGNGSTKPYSTLVIDPPLDVRLKRDTVRIYANVVSATHGETQSEVLGSGEGQGTFQQFSLSRKGLTYLPRETPTGMAPELTLRVNGVEWERGERPAELQASREGGLPSRYLARVNDDGRATLRTGDGKELGERLPTGVANVVVEYRIGGGQAGNVREGSVTQLPSPPLNVTKVRNLQPASGGVDPEGIGQARTGIPLAATALDRLVSLADYESFARKFAGIAKAQATFLTVQGRAAVVVTVAALDDAPLGQDSLLFRNLDGALRRHSDPDQEIILLHREQLLLLLRGKVRIDPRYVWDSVRSEILGRLVRRFSFENAKLAEDVLLSDVISEIQAVHGVRYVDIDAFDRMRQFYDNTIMIEKERLFAEIKRPGASVRVQRARELDDERVPLVVDAGQGVQCLPAQLAYFTNLPGTIDLEKAP